MVRLLLAPPRELPAAVTAELDRSAVAATRLASGTAALTYMAMLVVIPFCLLLGLEDWRPLVPYVSCVVAMILLGFGGARLTKLSLGLYVGAIVMSDLAIALLCPLFGPYLVIPALVAVNTFGFLLNAPRKPWRIWAIGLGLVTVITPALLELGGVIPRTTFFENGRIVIDSTMVRFPEGATVAVMLITIASVIFVPSLFVSRIRDALAVAEQRMVLQSWHLRQLVPDKARGALLPPEFPEAALLGCVFTSKKVR
jgi:hypothetical protein